MKKLLLILICLLFGCSKIEKTIQEVTYDDRVFYRISLPHYSVGSQNETEVTIEGSEYILVEDHFLYDYNQTWLYQPSLYYDGYYGELSLENSEYIDMINIEYVSGNDLIVSDLLFVSDLLIWEEAEERVNYYLHDDAISEFKAFLNQNVYLESDGFNLDELNECGKVQIGFDFSSVYCTQFKMYYDSKSDMYYLVDQIHDQKIYQFDLNDIKSFDSRCEGIYC